MSTQTSNLGLNKPDISDTPGVTIPQLASNFDKIDASLASITKKAFWIDPIQDYGCKGDGVTDDTTNFQKALSALPIGGVLVLPAGSRFLITQSLTAPNGYVTIKSESSMHGVADGNTYATGLVFKLPASSTALTINGQKITLKNLFIQEQGKTNGCTFISSNNDVHAENCQFYDWGTAVSLTNGSWYSKFINCEWICGTGVNIGSGCYDVHFITPKFSCDTALNIGSGAKPISVFGGSIENFTSSGGVILATNSQFNCYGTYWESSGATAPVGILMASQSSVNLYGNYVFLTNMNRWVNASGLVNASINAHGNRFASQTNSTTNAIAYYVPNSGQLDLSGDEFIEVPTGGYGIYLGGSNFSVAGFKIIPPTTSNYKPIQYQGNDMVCVSHTSAPPAPTTNGLYLADGVNWDPLTKAYGRAYFVLWSGSAWVSIT